jgi:hypothetical protein
MRQQVNLSKVDIGIQLLDNTNLVVDIIPPGIRFVPLLGRCPRFISCFLLDPTLLDVFLSQSISFGLRLVAGSPDEEHPFEGVEIMQGVLHVLRCCIIMRFISNIHIEF